MADQISLQMEGNTCTVTIPDGSYLRVKVYAPRRQFPVLEGKNTSGTVKLFPGETMQVDAYGEGGEGDLLKSTYLLTEAGLVEQKRRPSDDVTVVVKEAKFNQEQAIQDYTELQRRISVGAYEERSSYHYETGTWPEDGVEESVFNLEELAAKHDLMFCWHSESGIWTLEPISEETRAARQAADYNRMIDERNAINYANREKPWLPGYDE